MEASVSQPGMLDSLKDTLSPSNIAEKVRSNKDVLLEIGVYTGIGFIAGFMLKRFNRAIFILVGIGVVLCILQQMGIVTIITNWARVYEMLGMQPMPVAPDATAFSQCTLWVRMNMRPLISFIVGVLLGLKLG